ncbi:MAG: GNAT family N-acetyltransferase [Clostridiales bacterium]|nr:GNAT family N-acetyltransferase [Clostridiales bacterium]
MLDKTIEFHDILMRRKAGTPLFEYMLPKGYSFVYYKKGDEKAWVDTEYSVEEFDSKKAAMDYFRKRYLPYAEELQRRCLFIEDSHGNKIATLTIWWEYIGKRRYPWVSWVAVKPGCQGRGIGKALIYKGMKLMLEIEGDIDSYLKTQTWSYKAINIYRGQGFEIVKEKVEGNWNNGDYDKMMSVLNEHLR